MSRPTGDGPVLRPLIGVPVGEACGPDGCAPVDAVRLLQVTDAAGAGSPDRGDRWLPPPTALGSASGE